jgi:GNAT superfamily N-acetyltransferase
MLKLIMIVLILTSFLHSKCETTFIKLADKEELKQALKVLHDSYVEKRYMIKAKNGLRENEFTYLDTTKTIVVKHLEKVIGTISLIYDSKVGIPSDKILKDEIDKLRELGNIVEVSSLAIDKEYRKLKLTDKIIEHLFANYLNRDINFVIITINPKALEFYKQIGFIEIGNTEDYDFVHGTPGIVMYLEVNK